MDEDIVRHNAAHHRFEAGSEANPAHLDYRLRDGAVDMIHTEVPPEYQGQGLAGKLAAAALDWTRDSNRKVIPSCSYVANYLKKHPEYSGLL